MAARIKNVLPEKNDTDFAKKAISALWKDMRTRDIRLDPLIIRMCNGGYSWPLSNAIVQYQKGTPPMFELKNWFQNGFEKLINVLRQKDEIANEHLPAFQCLLHYFDGNHLECLKSLRKSDNITELEIATVMAVHYFKPLVPDGYYAIDMSYADQKSTKLCACKEEIITKDTNIGNDRVWYGTVDILLKNSVVHIGLARKMEGMNLQESEEEKNSEENDALSENCCDSFGASEDTMKSHKSQFLAETIVNAFLVTGQKDVDRNLFVPSFFVNENTIRVALYNVEKDILLMGTKMPIWDDETENEYELSIVTLVYVWLCLNFFGLVQGKAHGCDLLKFTPISNFKSLVSNEEDAYSVYLKDIHYPVSPSKPFMRPLDTDKYPDPASVEKVETDISLYQQMTKLFTS